MVFGASLVVSLGIPFGSPVLQGGSQLLCCGACNCYVLHMQLVLMSFSALLLAGKIAMADADLL